MSTTTPYTASEIADVIDWYKAAYALANVLPVVLHEPQMRQMLMTFLLDEPMNDPGKTDGWASFGRSDGTYHKMHVKDFVFVGTNSPRFNLEYLGTLLMTAITVIGDRLSRCNYFDKAPVLEFFRHIRNGISHGNKFHFRGQEPARPAYFGAFTVTHSLEGNNILLQYMGTGDVMDLFDAVAAHLRQLPS